MNDSTEPRTRWYMTNSLKASLVQAIVSEDNWTGDYRLDLIRKVADLDSGQEIPLPPEDEADVFVLEELEDRFPVASTIIYFGLDLHVQMTVSREG